MALVKTPDGKYTYESNDAAQVEAVAVLYEPTPQEKAKQVLARAAAARGETPAEEPAPTKADAKPDDGKDGKKNA